MHPEMAPIEIRCTHAQDALLNTIGIRAPNAIPYGADELAELPGTPFTGEGAVPACESV